MTNILETSRCLLSPTTKEDREDIFGLYSNEDVRRYLGGTVDEQIFNTRFSEMIMSSDTTNWTIRLKKDGVFIGIISIDQHHDGQDHEISYQLLPMFWGKGLALEIIDAVLRYAKNTMNLTNIVAETQQANVPSKKLLEKLGMQPIKTVTRFGEKQIIYRKDFF